MAPPLKPLDPPAELPAGAKLHPRELAKAFAKTKNKFRSFYRRRFLFLKRNSQWPRWGLSGSVCIQLCPAPPSCLQLSLQLGVSHQSNSVFFVPVPSTWLWRVRTWLTNLPQRPPASLRVYPQVVDESSTVDPGLLRGFRER